MGSNRVLPSFPDLPPARRARLISIVISNRNYADYVGAAVDSALSQRDVRVEVIVVDDGSTDGSREVLERFTDRTRVIFQAGRGQTGALNEGFAAATGDVIMFLDADDVLRPDIGALVRDAFVRRPEAGRWCPPRTGKPSRGVSEPVGAVRELALAER